MCLFQLYVTEIMSLYSTMGYAWYSLHLTLEVEDCEVELEGFSVIFGKHTVDHVTTCHTMGPDLDRGIGVGYRDRYSHCQSSGKEMKCALEYGKGESHSLSRACCPWRGTQSTGPPFWPSNMAIVLKGEAKVARNDLRGEHNWRTVGIGLSDIQF